MRSESRFSRVDRKPTASGGAALGIFLQICRRISGIIGISAAVFESQHWPSHRTTAGTM
jgi:hypothetical protein